MKRIRLALATAALAVLAVAPVASAQMPEVRYFEIAGFTGSAALDKQLEPSADASCQSGYQEMARTTVAARKRRNARFPLFESHGGSGLAALRGQYREERTTYNADCAPVVCRASFLWHQGKGSNLVLSFTKRGRGFDVHAGIQTFEPHEDCFTTMDEDFFARQRVSWRKLRRSRLTLVFRANNSKQGTPGEVPSTRRVSKLTVKLRRVRG